ncbi:Germination-specific N-acetylmuramoyl-L-alanine amidase [Sporomusa rhizae]|uniref:N-acetylmuramoyl-L-alanine amidase family protein n=1 Tax=Sporomusa rhizae TaxID=357999 RepID=UPI00352A73CF
MLYCDDYNQKNIGECYSGCGGVSKPLLNKIVVLDPGHGGIYSGGVHYGFRESDINLSVALKVRKKLARLGAKVIMTRKRDVNLAPEGSTLDADLQARVDVAKNSGADIFVSLHVDDVPNINLKGVTSYFPEGRSSGLASAIQTSLVNEICVVDNGVSPANFYVLVHNDVPSALIEMGYLSNPAEALRLMNNSYQNLLARGIAKGILNYFLCR